MADENQAADAAEQSVETAADGANGQEAKESTPEESGIRKELEYWRSEARKAFEERDKARQKAKQKAKPSDKPPAAAPREEEGQSDGVAELRAEVEQMRREKRFSDALFDAKLTLTKEQRSLLETAYHAVKPEDVAEWLSGAAKAFPAPAAAVAPKTEARIEDKAAATPKEQAPNVSNQAAAVTSAAGSLPDDPRLIPPEVWRSMTREERIKRVNQFTSTLRTRRR